MSENKTFLVTGCAGFIASRVVAQLTASGHNVVGIDSVNDAYDPRLKEHRLDQIGHERFQFVRGDIESISTLETVFAENKFDAVLNLAARAGVRYSMENPFVYMTTNAMGSLNLLEQMRQHGVKKYVLASTSSLYAGQEIPFLETLAVNTPISPYAASKKAAEVMAHTYHHLHDLDVSICRYFTVYGPAGRPDMCIFRFIKWIDEGTPLEVFGDGQQARDFTFVEDIAAGTIAALQPVGYEIFNLGGGGTPVTLNDIIERIEKLLNKPASRNTRSFHKADIKITAANIEKAQQMLGWTPQTGLDDGLAACVNWYLDNKPFSSDLLLP